jgi:hypothetical protein
MSVSVSQLSEYMKHGLNVLITGEAGTGKTHMLREAANKLGYTMKYYSASTLDPFTDLVGVPVPETDKETGKRSLHMVRPHDVDDADVIFFDEANRADSKTLNALFEIIQFRSINGEALPKLKAVVAAVNPNNGEYKVSDFDPALLDRFDLYLESSKDPSLSYFKTVFGEKVATALVQWHKEHSNVRTANKYYLSPRRLERIGAAYLKVPALSTLQNSMPPGGVFDTKKLYILMEEACGRAKAAPTPKVKVAPAKPAGKLLDATKINNFYDGAEVRKNAKDIAYTYTQNAHTDKKLDTAIFNAVVKGYRYSVGPRRMLESAVAPIIVEMYDKSGRGQTHQNNWSQLRTHWVGTKLNQVIQEIRDYKAKNPGI